MSREFEEFMHSDSAEMRCECDDVGTYVKRGGLQSGMLLAGLSGVLVQGWPGVATALVVVAVTLFFVLQSCELLCSSCHLPATAPRPDATASLARIRRMLLLPAVACLLVAVLMYAMVDWAAWRENAFLPVGLHSGF